MRRKLRSNMVDSSIFIEAWDNTPVSGDCKLILDGAENGIFLGHVSTIILGEIMKKLLKLRADERESYRYDEIYNKIILSLMNFRILYICEDTVKSYPSDIRGGEQSQDKLNLSCAIKHNCNMFIMKDSAFSTNGKTPTKIIQITDKQNPKLRRLLDEIKTFNPTNG